MYGINMGVGGVPLLKSTDPLRQKGHENLGGDNLGGDFKDFWTCLLPNLVEMIRFDIHRLHSLQVGLIPAMIALQVKDQ